jgi:hypothetical protein
MWTIKRIVEEGRGVALLVQAQGSNCEEGWRVVEKEDLWKIMNIYCRCWILHKLQHSSHMCRLNNIIKKSTLDQCQWQQQIMTPIESMALVLVSQPWFRKNMWNQKVTTNSSYKKYYIKLIIESTLKFLHLRINKTTKILDYNLLFRIHFEYNLSLLLPDAEDEYEIV